MIHKDCFAYGSAKSDGCVCLNKLYCAYEECKFYKPKPKRVRKKSRGLSLDE